MAKRGSAIDNVPIVASTGQESNGAALKPNNAGVGKMLTVVGPALLDLYSVSYVYKQAIRRPHTSLLHRLWVWSLVAVARMVYSCASVALV
jgi:hypothetical protein